MPAEGDMRSGLCCTHYTWYATSVVASVASVEAARQAHGMTSAPQQNTWRATVPAGATYGAAPVSQHNTWLTPTMLSADLLVSGVSTVGAHTYGGEACVSLPAILFCRVWLWCAVLF